VLLRLDPGDAARAGAEFQRALEIARSQSALLFELRAARDLARLCATRARRRGARLLAPVYASFTEASHGLTSPKRRPCWRARCGTCGDACRAAGKAPPSPVPVC
jgi:hypothetical protein